MADFKHHLKVRTLQPDLYTIILSQDLRDPASNVLQTSNNYNTIAIVT